MKKHALLRILSLALIAVMLFAGCEVYFPEETSSTRTGGYAAAATEEAPFVELTEVTTAPQEEILPDTEPAEDLPLVTEDGEYTSRDEVAAYLHLYGHLPSNYITKKEAQALGWVNSEGNLWVVAPGKSIGGDWFGNYEGLLPTVKGRQYHECDIDFNGGRRNAKRIIFSNDGLIYYTEDHYESFELLYGEE